MKIISPLFSLSEVLAEIKNQLVHLCAF